MLNRMPGTGLRAVSSVDEVTRGMADHAYLPDEALATAVYLALRLRRPLLLEGEPGVGKTEVARVLSDWSGGRLIRLQCYEGIDVAQAVYEWDYARQLLHLRTLEATGRAQGADEIRLADELYDERFLVRRPLLEAISSNDAAPAVLLVDEVDRSDDEFEAFLLEVLSDYAITVPEIGTLTADEPPVVVITSNRTRDVHDAPETPLSLSLGSASRPSARGRDHRAAGAGSGADTRTPSCQRCRGDARDRPLQAAGRGRDHRLGAGVEPARRR